jgi:hypothetical protein
MSCGSSYGSSGPGQPRCERGSARFLRPHLDDPGRRPGTPAFRLVHHDLEPLDLALEGLDLALEAGNPLAQNPLALGRIGRGMEGGVAALASGLVLQQLGDLRKGETRAGP